MDLITVVTILIVVLSLIIYFILKSIKKAIFYTIITIAFLSVILIVSIFMDAKQLQQMSISKSLFIYTRENQPKIGIIIDFLQSESQALTKDEAVNKFAQLQSNSKELNQVYFKAFVFSEDALKEILPDEINVSPELNISKQKLIDGLNSQNSEEQASYFSIAVFNIFSNLNNENTMVLFLKNYKEKEIEIYPPIKAISVLSLMPEKIVKTVMSKN